MKTLLKLVVTLLVLNATARGAWAAYNYYQLKDAAQQLVTFSQKATSEQLQQEIVAKAEELNLPLKAEDVSVRRDGVRMVAEGSYVQDIEFFPNFPYPITFSFVVDALTLDSPAPRRRR
jgi:hypothetical protein